MLVLRRCEGRGVNGNGGARQELSRSVEAPPFDQRAGCQQPVDRPPGFHALTRTPAQPAPGSRSRHHRQLRRTTAWIDARRAGPSSSRGSEIDPPSQTSPPRAPRRPAGRGSTGCFRKRAVSAAEARPVRCRWRRGQFRLCPGLTAATSSPRRGAQGGRPPPCKPVLDFIRPCATAWRKSSSSVPPVQVPAKRATLPSPGRGGRHCDDRR